MKNKIIILDDDQDIRNLLKEVLFADGNDIELHENPNSLLSSLMNSESSHLQPTLLICDIELPGMRGIEFVEKAKKYLSDIPVVFITAHASVELAVESMRNGGFDFLVKPIDIKNLKVVCERALKFSKLSIQNKLLKKEIKSKWEFSGILGKSDKIQEMVDLIKRVSVTDLSVLITGDSGSGKELVANAIHSNSSRKDKPFMALNCASIPENLLESELFGHAKGSFTGASFKKLGLFQEASGGTIFLDEIGDMPMHLQSKLLRVLQEKKVKPVGETTEVDIDVRLVAATHKNLGNEIKEGKFREDLYFRLNVLPISVPSLKKRTADIPLLSNYFLESFLSVESSNQIVKSISNSAMDKLIKHSWPGNVRELKNTIERAAVLAEGEEISDKEIVFDTYSKTLISENQEVIEAKECVFPEELSLKEVEREYIKHVLERSKGVKEKAAKILGIDRKTLYRKEKLYEFDQMDFDREN